MTKKIIIILAVYSGLLVALEGMGQLAIGWLESRRPSGTFAEDILNHDEPVLGFGLKKSISKSIANWSVRTNHLGFRDPQELPKIKPPGEFRIFIVGGSTVFGWGVKEADTIPRQIQHLVDQKLAGRALASRQTVRVINAGVPWYASWHEAAFVFFHILDLDPDWIIVMDGLNDTAFAMGPRWSPIVDGFVDAPTRLAYEKRKAGETLMNPLLTFLKLSPSFRYFYAKLKDRERLNQGVPHPEVWEQYVTYMDRLATFTTARNIKFSLFFQPVMTVEKTLVYTEVISDGTSMRDARFAEKFRQLYLAGEERISQDTRLPFTSLKSAFKKETAIMYIDGLHYSEAGNKLLAERIFDHDISPWLTSAAAETRTTRRIY
jgi:lysophospholipase L1-like esterase